MNVLLDSCVWGGALSRFREEGIDAVWAGDWPEDPGDEEILRRADEGRRVLITLDKDFGELAVLRGFRHSGIVRLVGFRAEEQGIAGVYLVGKYSKELESGAIITASPGWVRIRSGGWTEQ